MACPPSNPPLALASLPAPLPPPSTIPVLSFLTSPFPFPPCMSRVPQFPSHLPSGPQPLLPVSPPVTTEACPVPHLSAVPPDNPFFLFAPLVPPSLPPRFLTNPASPSPRSLLAVPPACLQGPGPLTLGGSVVSLWGPVHGATPWAPSLLPWLPRRAGSRAQGRGEECVEGGSTWPSGRQGRGVAGRASWHREGTRGGARGTDLGALRRSRIGEGKEGDWDVLITCCVLGPLPGPLWKPTIFFHPHNIHCEADRVIPGLHISRVTFKGIHDARTRTETVSGRWNCDFEPRSL